jgi:hypothetical protein
MGCQRMAQGQTEGNCTMLSVGRHGSRAGRPNLRVLMVAPSLRHRCRFIGTASRHFGARAAPSEPALRYAPMGNGNGPGQRGRGQGIGPA